MLEEKKKTHNSLFGSVHVNCFEVLYCNLCVSVNLDAPILLPHLGSSVVDLYFRHFVCGGI